MKMFKSRSGKKADNEIQATFRSLLTNDYLFSVHQWVISIVRKQGTEHSFLILEGMREHEPVIIRSDLFLDEGRREEITENLPAAIGRPLNFFWELSQNLNGTAFIRLKELESASLADLLLISESQSWSITTEQAEKLIARLIREAGKPIRYILPGEQSSSSSSASSIQFHNCTTWCEQILQEEIGVKVGKGRWALIHKPSETVQKAIADAKKQAIPLTDRTVLAPSGP